MGLMHLTLGERMVMVARLMAAEHLQQEAADAGVNLAHVQRVIRANSVRQDLFVQPVAVNSRDGQRWDGSRVSGRDPKEAA